MPHDPAPQAVVVADAAHRIASWDAGAEHLYGYTAAEVVGRPTTDLLAPREDYAALREKMAGLVAGGSWTGRVWVRPRGGEDRLVELSVHGLLDGAGAYCGSVSVARDPGAHGPGASEVPGDPAELVLLVDMHGEVVFASASFLGALGYGPAGLPRRILDLLHPDDHEAFLVVSRAARRPGPLPLMRARLRTAGGGWRWVEGRGQRRSAEGAKGLVVLLGHDVTDVVAVEERARELAALVEASPDAIVRTTLDGTITYWSPGAEALLGFRSADVVGRTTFETVVPPGLVEQSRAMLRRAAEGRRGGPETTRRLHADGTPLDLSLTVGPLRDASGAVVGTVAILHDVRELVDALARLRASEQRYRVIVETAHEAVLLLDADGVVVFGNPRAERVFGPLTGQGRALADLVPEEQRPLVRGHQEHAGPDSYELRLVDASGLPVSLQVGTAPLLDDAGRPAGSVAMLTDVTARKRAEAALTRMALTDGLTGLPNRTLLLDRLEHALLRRGRATMAVLFLDLDNFKAVNDSLGHAAGDTLLRVVAGRLRAAVRPSDTVARLGGDEFVVLCEDLDDEAHASDVAERALAAVRQPVELVGVAVTPTASVGITLPQGEEAPETLLRDADTAMYYAKATGGHRVCVFRPEQHASAVERLDLLSHLPDAAGRGQLELHYQPFVDVGDGRVLGVEALLRWWHPQRGLLGPGSFIPLAESTGLIHDIGRWVLGEALRQSAEWTRQGAAHLARVAVNLSARQVADPSLPGRVTQALEDAGADPRLVTVEITESAFLADPGTALRTLRGLRDLGVSVSIDDFGTGYSSLMYLKHFPVDEIKIDRTFVADVPTSGADRTIVASLVRLARGFGARTTAEGVETPEQWAALRDLGCDRAQGFLFARPAPAGRMGAHAVLPAAG